MNFLRWSKINFKEIKLWWNYIYSNNDCKTMLMKYRIKIYLL